MNTQTKWAVPSAGSVSRPWLWQVWAAVIILFVVTLALPFALPPPLAVTPPTLSFLGDTCTVTARATNHTDQSTAAKLLVMVGIGTPTGRYRPPAYSEFARKTVPLSLAPKESRTFSCEFLVAGHPLPNTARIEIAPPTTPAR